MTNLVTLTEAQKAVLLAREIYFRGGRQHELHPGDALRCTVHVDGGGATEIEVPVSEECIAYGIRILPNGTAELIRR